jgi:hypothetical protein
VSYRTERKQRTRQRDAFNRVLAEKDQAERCAYCRRVRGRTVVNVTGRAFCSEDCLLAAEDLDALNAERGRHVS